MYADFGPDLGEEQSIAPRPYTSTSSLLPSQTPSQLDTEVFTPSQTPPQPPGYPSTAEDGAPLSGKGKQHQAQTKSQFVASEEAAGTTGQDKFKTTPKSGPGSVTEAKRKRKVAVLEAATFLTICSFM
jgi:hypothetical protein